MVETPTAKRIHSEPDRLWRIVTDYPDIFDSLIVPKLNGNDVKFFYDVNTESRVAIKRSSGSLCATFKICDFFTKSTLSWALEKCSEKKERFCVEMALSGNLVLLQYLHEKGCPWDEGLVLMLPERSPRVFEIFTRKRMSLERRVLVLLLHKMVTSSV